LLCIGSMLSPAHLTLATPQAYDQLSADRSLTRLRAQAAVVRALVHSVERLEAADEGQGLRDQLAEEMARLGQLLEATTSTPGPDESGVVLRSSLGAP